MACVLWILNCLQVRSKMIVSHDIMKDYKIMFIICSTQHSSMYDLVDFLFSLSQALCSLFRVLAIHHLIVKHRQVVSVFIMLYLLTRSLLK